MTEIETYRERGSMLQPVTDGWVDSVGDVVKLSEYVAGTEFVPASLRGNPAKVAAAILAGRELGLPPMTSLSSVHVINGKPGISAELMRGLVAQRGHQIRVVKSSSTEVTMRGRRLEDVGDADAWTETTWTYQDAERAGLIRSQPNYTKYPKQMLTARATTDLCRLIFADVIHGLRSVEELQAITVDDEVVVEYQAGQIDPPKAPRAKREPRVQPVDEGAPAEQAQEPPAQGRTTTRRRPGLTRRGAQAGSGVAVPDVEAPASGGDPAAPESPAAAEPQAPTSADAPAADDAPADGQPGQPEEAGTSLAPSSGEAADQPAQDGTPDEDVVDAEVVEDPATALQLTKLVTVFGKLGVAGPGKREERQYMTGVLAGRTVESAKDLTKSEASRVIDALEQCETNEDLQAVINHTADHDEQAGS